MHSRSFSSFRARWPAACGITEGGWGWKVLTEFAQERARVKVFFRSAFVSMGFPVDFSPCAQGSADPEASGWGFPRCIGECGAIPVRRG